MSQHHLSPMHNVSSPQRHIIHILVHPHSPARASTPLPPRLPSGAPRPPPHLRSAHTSHLPYSPLLLTHPMSLAIRASLTRISYIICLASLSPVFACLSPSHLRHPLSCMPLPSHLSCMPLSPTPPTPHAVRVSLAHTPHLTWRACPHRPYASPVACGHSCDAATRPGTHPHS